MKQKGQPEIFRLIDKAIYDYNMLESGDRVLIGASGGKDSTALIEYFAARAKRPNAGFDLLALTIATDVSPEIPAKIREKFSDWNVKCETVKISVLNRVQEGRHMNCWWCSTQRRKELLDFAVREGYNKIALGHHMDDILETLLMNMLHKTELSTMPPVMVYRDYPVSVIRPLCYVPVDLIIEHATERGYIGHTCTCTYQDNSGRKTARQKLFALTEGKRSLKEHLYKSLQNIRPEYLP